MKYKIGDTFEYKKTEITGEKECPCCGSFEDVIEETTVRSKIKTTKKIECTWYALANGYVGNFVDKFNIDSPMNKLKEVLEITLEDESVHHI